jgi:integrase
VILSQPNVPTQGILPKKGIANMIREAFTDFILSRKAVLCSEHTIDFYERMLTPFIEDYKLTSKGVREYLSDIADRDVASATVHAYARAVRAFVRFCFAEGYIKEEIKVAMPKVKQKKMEVLSPDEIKTLLKEACLRDRALVLFLIDSGARRSEALGLEWSDIDFNTGSVLIRNGKGGKARTVAIGVNTRRTLIKLKSREQGQRVFKLTGSGLATVFYRLSKQTGIHIHAHKCRRTFATMALRNGMNLFALQRILGHSTLEMTRLYAQQVSDDLIQAHKESGPIDKLFKRGS